MGGPNGVSGVVVTVALEEGVQVLLHGRVRSGVPVVGTSGGAGTPKSGCYKCGEGFA